MSGASLLIRPNYADSVDLDICSYSTYDISGLEERVKELSWSKEEFDELVKGLREGDSSSMSVLWRRFNPSLLRFLRSLGVSDPDDIAQETWVSLARAIRTFEGTETNLKALVFHIARRRLADHLRAQYRRPPTVEIDYNVVQFSTNDPDHVGQLDDLERALGMLQILPESQSEVLALRIIGGFDIKTVAELVGRSEGSVRVLSHRGLARLAELIEKSRKNANELDSSGTSKEGR